MTDKSSQDKSPISFMTLFLSVLSAFIGVQSSSNHQRDFSNGKISHFIIIGLIFGLIFILLVVGVVNIVMSFTGT